MKSVTLAHEVDWEGCNRVQMQNVAGWKNVPVKVIG